MAHSPGSAERRAHLIREMARSSERSRSRGSAASSVPLAQHDYDTETQHLPALQPETDFQINTSALRRAFPDFSQYGSSEEDSIEFGRGVKRSAENPSNDIPDSADVSENITLDLGPGGLYRVVGTPPMKPRNTNIQPKLSAANASKADAPLRRTVSSKENENPLVKTTDFVSGSSNKGSSKGSQNGNRSLADMHARVESDDSGVLHDARPQPVAANTKNTRFSGTRRRHTSTNTEASSYGPPGSLGTEFSGIQAQRQDQTSHNHTLTSNISGGNGTHQSYMLPDIPNITELVSGTRQDGTPLLQRSVKARSRFGTPRQTRRSPNLKQAHVPIEEVPVPADQKALQLCLQLLQDKVAELERDKASAEKAMDEYELEVLQLRSTLEGRDYHQQTGGHGANSEFAMVKDCKDDNVLEDSMKALQDRLDRANRKLSASEVAINNLTRDRQTAHQQLEVAHVNSEELRAESLAVRTEIETVKRQVARLTREHENKIERLTAQENELRAKIQRREKAINEMGFLANELWATRRFLNDSKSYAQPMVEQGLQTQTADNPTETGRSFSRTQNSARPGSNTHQRTHSSPDDNTTGQLSNPDSTTNIRELTGPQVVQNVSRDETYFSFMAGDELPKMRQLLEEDKALLAKRAGVANEGLAGTSTRINSQSSTIPRKSSLKRSQSNEKQHMNAVKTSKVNMNSAKPIQNEDVESGDARPTVSLPREKEDTQRSIFSQRSERMRRSTTGVSSEVTSAFILPDITLTGDALASQKITSNTTKTGKLSMTVRRPVPVSERMPIPGHGEEDATIRPAQPPGLALATVLKGLEDELAKLRAQLAQQEALYHQHDPSLSRRKRKIVYARIQKLLPAIDMRADQIYALYDVLEGQKEKGQLMPEEEVEVTLQSIGIDTATARNVSEGQSRNTVVSSGVEALRSEDDHSGSEGGPDDEEDLPWEGFEATQTQTLGSLRSGLRMH